VALKGLFMNDKGLNKYQFQDFLQPFFCTVSFFSVSTNDDQIDTGMSSITWVTMATWHTIAIDKQKSACLCACACACVWEREKER